MNNSIELTRKIYDEALDWYNTAENKAQILLGLIGTFTVFTSGIILGNPGDIKVIVSNFNFYISIVLGFAFLLMMYGLFAAFKCLQSRGLDKNKNENDKQVTYADEQMYFFGHHANHDSNKLFQSLNVIDKEKELKIYSVQIIALSKNVAEKHRWINKAFGAICISIFLLLITTVLYIINIA